MQADKQLNFVVHRISINRNGSALLLAGSDHLCVMNLYGRNSTEENTIICRYSQHVASCFRSSACGVWCLWKQRIEKCHLPDWLATGFILTYHLGTLMFGVILFATPAISYHSKAQAVWSVFSIQNYFSQIFWLFVIPEWFIIPLVRSNSFARESYSRSFFPP